MKHIKPTCKLIAHKILSKEFQRLGIKKYIPCKFCKTHNVVVCRCGYEFSKHPWWRDKENDLIKEDVKWGEDIEDVEILFQTT